MTDDNPPASLIGREGEIGAMGKALRRSRMLALTGPGGVGRTRLAREVVGRLTPPPVDGELVVDLAALPAGWDVAVETARALGLRSRGGTAAVDAVVRHIDDRDALLVLDHCDHVVDSCAELAVALLGRCPRLRIVATSREAFGIHGERVWDVDPLEPEDARRLFVERARTRRADFDVEEDCEADEVTHVCDLLGRVPLGIELAAARVATMSVAEISAGLDASVGDRSGTRGRSVRAAVRWSYQLLDPTEQRGFRRLAVFVGGFDAAAAQAVAPGLTPELLERLVDASLVTVAPGAGARRRYRLSETVRECAWDLLADAGEVAAASSRHLHHYASQGQAEDVDYPNVRVAAEWAATADPGTGMRLLARTRDLFLRLGHADGLRLARPLLELSQARDRDRVVVQITAGLLALSLAGPRAAELDLVEARQLSAKLGDEPLEAWARYFQGVAELADGAVGPARAHLEAARERFRSLGLAEGEAQATAALGLTHLPAGEIDLAFEALAASGLGIEGEGGAEGHVAALEARTSG